MTPSGSLLLAALHWSGPGEGGGVGAGVVAGGLEQVRDADLLRKTELGGHVERGVLHEVQRASAFCWSRWLTLGLKGVILAGERHESRPVDERRRLKVPHARLTQWWQTLSFVAL